MSAYSGSLSSKRKADLLEIAEALGLPDTASSTVADLVNSIQSYLKENEERLINNDQFKGLFGRRPRHQSSESDTAVDVKNAVDTTVKKSRKSINKVVERVANAIDPANISLPESPINVNRIAEVAEQAKDAATEQLAVALAPAQELIPDELAVQVKHARHHLTQYVQDSKLRIEDHVRLLQAHLSKPEHLVGTAIAIEALFVLFNVVQSYNRTYFFPPPGGDKGTFGSLLHGLFFWLPSFALTVRVPDWISFNPTSSVWPALTWWATTTVLPPFALSTLVSYVPQKGITRTGHNTRYASSHPPRPTADPLTFALIRLAILLYPLTDAAPSSFVDALDISGNAQVRALGAGLLAALLLVGRLSS